MQFGTDDRGAVELTPGTLQFSERVLATVAAVQASYIRDRDEGEVFEDLLRHALSITDSAHGFVGEVEEGLDGNPCLRLRAVTDVAWDAESRATIDLVRTEGLVMDNLETLYGHVLTTGKPVVTNDARNDPRSGGTAPSNLPLDRFMGLPLWSDGELLGIIGVSDRERGYGDDLVRALEPFTASCATLVFAVREERELSRSRAQLEALAQTLRESLLPPEMPSIGWLDLGAGFRPAADGAGVMGDFYDVFQTVPGRWFLVVGDVRGHGPDAAKTTALARWSLRAHAPSAADPAALLVALNDQLLARGEPDAPHLSAVVALVDINESPTLSPLTVRLATAGHPPPMIRRADGEIRRLAPQGTILGVYEDAGVQSREVELAAGDILLLFTDGVIEGAHRDLLYGELDLADALAAAQCTSAQDAAEVALRVAGELPKDDVAAVALRVPN